MGHMNDGYTLEMRMCDDEGFVSNKAIEEEREIPLDPSLTYLDRLNYLRNLTRQARGDKPETLDVSYVCTGHAHLAGEHIRCTSPAHQQARGTLLKSDEVTRMAIALAETPVTIELTDEQAREAIISQAMLSPEAVNEVAKIINRTRGEEEPLSPEDREEAREALRNARAALRRQ